MFPYQGISSQILEKWERHSRAVFQGPWNISSVSNSAWSNITFKKHAGKKINSWNLLSWSWTLFCSGMNQIAGPNVFWPNWAWPISEHKGSQKSSVVGSHHRHSLAIQVGVLTQNFPKPKSFKQKFSKRPDCLELVGNICVSDVEGVAPSQSSTFTAPSIHLWGESASISKNVRSMKCYFAVFERS